MENAQKFSGKAEVYTEGRPTYAQEFIDWLYQNCITDKKIIADVGCGTGKFTEQLLKKGSIVYGIEPNDDMRNVAQKELQHYKNFVAVNGTSSATTLPDSSVDFVTAAQAFHWFDVAEFYDECKRILKKDGKVALIWNTRDISADINVKSYNIYKQYCPAFKGFGGGISEDDARISEFFKGNYKKLIFDNPLIYDKEKFIKRSLSGSYSIKNGDENFDKYIAELENLFDKYAENNFITMPNYTAVYIGEI